MVNTKRPDRYVKDISFNNNYYINKLLFCVCAVVRHAVIIILMAVFWLERKDIVIILKTDKRFVDLKDYVLCHQPIIYWSVSLKVSKYCFKFM